MGAVSDPWSTQPPPRQIDSWRAAEENAAVWMRHWGFLGASVTPQGPDGGIDVRASTALAQVKWEGAQTGAPTLQRLVGARRSEYDKTLLFFSGAGYSSRAIEYADELGVALFKYSLNGRMTPVNPAARDVLSAAGRRHGRGWWGRNWLAVLGTMFLGWATIAVADLVLGLSLWRELAWYDPLGWVGIGVFLLSIWRLSAGRRQRWKDDRQDAPPGPSLWARLSQLVEE